MARYSSVFKSFNSIAQQIKSAGPSSVVTSFDSLVARVDKFAKIVNSVADRHGKQDTDGTDLAAQSGGDATAVGESTLSKGAVKATAADVGLVSYAVGSTTFTAAAASPVGENAFATTSTFADVAGADLVLVRNTTSEFPLTAGAETAFSTSTATYVGINFEFWSSQMGPLVLETTKQASAAPQLNLKGNVATLDGALQANGVNTVASIDSQVLTVENTLSTVSASGVIGVGD